MRFEVLAFAISIATTNAVVVNTYSDKSCGTYVGQTNVYDNTCSKQPGFQSYQIVAAGSDGQFLTSYSAGNCVDPTTSCNSVKVLNTCYPAVDGNGGSNSFTSGVSCGAA